MLNGLPEIPVARIAALAAISAGLIAGTAVAAAPAGSTTDQARGGCHVAAVVTGQHIASAELFRAAGCF